MIRIFLLMLMALVTLNANASVQAKQKNYNTEFKMIESRFDKVKPMIVKISKEQGVDPSLMTTLIFKESRFDTMAKNKQGSSAKGLVGMTDPTRRAMLKKYGSDLGLAKNANIHNPRVAILLATAYVNEVEADLTRRLKREPSHAEKYLAYKFGSGGALAMLKKNSAKAKREMRQYRKDAAFYGALVKPVPVTQPTNQLAFVKTVNAEKISELQQIWHTLYGAYTPVTRTTLAFNIPIGANLEHSRTTLVSRNVQSSAADRRRHFADRAEG